MYLWNSNLFESHFLYPYFILGKVPGVAHGVLNIFDKKNSEQKKIRLLLPFLPLEFTRVACSYKQQVLNMQSLESLEFQGVPCNYYFISTSNKTSKKNSKLIFLCSSLFSYIFEKCDSSEFQGGIGPPLQVQGEALPPLPFGLHHYYLMLVSNVRSSS